MLPLSMDPADYGTIIGPSQPVQIEGKEVFRTFVQNGTKIFQLDKTINKLLNLTIQNVTILGPIDLTWTDTLLHNGVVKREIGKSEYFFIDGQIILRKKAIVSKPFSKVKADSKLINNFATIDIETIKQGDRLVPYLISGYNGTEFIHSYAQKNEGVIDQKLLFKSFIDQLSTFIGKNKSLIVYAHNLSAFDGIFLLKQLLGWGSVIPIIHKGKLIAVKVKLPNGKSIYFKDSFLFLPTSIRKLCLTFKISIPKGYFPFKLYDIFYKGILPAFEYWTDISLEEYLGLNKKFGTYGDSTWSFKDEAIKYCELDCKCLFEILIKFNELIFKHFSINIHNSLTLPALAMKIYKSKYMPDNTIFQLPFSIDRDIRDCFTGGAVDVYIPHNREGSFFTDFFITLFYYDVNSLYPFIMSKTPMPIGKGKIFEGDIRAVDPTTFGYFFCKITSPDDIKNPILQRRIQTPEGLRTIAGIGTWEGWIFSGEMDNAIRKGYKFTIIRGYEFEKGYIFKDYVDAMYNLRMLYSKGDPMNYVAKLLMNSLYGKFGMKSTSTKVEIFNTNFDEDLALFNDLIENLAPSIQDWIKIDDHLIVIREVKNYSGDDDDSYHGLDVNVAISAAITAGGRMWMSTIIDNNNFTVYYSDTDSIVIDKFLPADLVGTALGQFKLEHVIKRAVFLAPKVYGLITENGEEIIKIKGIKPEALKDLHVQDLEALLIKDSSREVLQEKWFKKMFEGSITINDVAYNLKTTSNKRQTIYVNDVFEYTKPYNYNDIISK